MHAALGEGILIVPYVKPGFDLAVACARLLVANPDAKAMVLLQHGLAASSCSSVCSPLSKHCGSIPPQTW